MHDLKYLTEKDLEYFRNKQKEGDPVRIIYLNPEALDKISFADIDRMEKKAREQKDRQPAEEALEQWLKERGAVIDTKKAEEKIKAEKEVEKRAEQEKATGE